jgi:hypothetical protein
MKKLLFFVGLLCSVSGFSQASAREEGGQVTFEKTDAAIGYNGFSLEYLFPSYSMNTYAFSSSGIALSYEAYKPLGKRTAASANLSLVLLDQVKNLEFNVGFYFLPYKGIYLKPQIGYGSYSFDDNYNIPKGNFTYRAQAGYLFAVNKEGKRPKFIDLGFAYHTATNSVLTVNYFGISVKYLWGPKPQK